MAGRKAAWSDEALRTFTSGCVVAIVAPARRDYYARAKAGGNDTPRPFPERELAASVEPMCACIGRRAAASYDLETFFANLETLSKPFVEAAMQGGQCRPEGVLGAELGHARQ